MNNQISQNMKRRHQFEDPAPAAETQPAASETQPNSEQQLVTLLTEMGLSAEQATAVYQMAQDLAKGNTDTGDQTTDQTQVQASRHRRSLSADDRRTIARRARMSQMRRERFSDDRPSRFSDDRMPSREHFAGTRGEREEMGRRRKPRGRRNMSREQFGRQGTEQARHNFQSSIIRRQRAELAEMRQQLAALGQMPAARKLSSNVTAPAPVVVPAQGSVKDRVFQTLKGIL